MRARLRRRKTRRSRAIPDRAGASPTAGRETNSCSNDGARLEGELAEVALVGRHLAPAEDGEVLAAAICSIAGLLRRARVVVARQERHADGVLADRRAGRSPTTARRNSSGICVRMPAPSPVPASEPIAPRCSRLRSAVSAWSTMSCPGLAAQGRDHGQATGVLLESGVVHPLLRGECADGSPKQDGLAAISTVLTVMLRWDDVGPCCELSTACATSWRLSLWLAAPLSIHPRAVRSRRRTRRCPAIVPQPRPGPARGRACTARLEPG